MRFLLAACLLLGSTLANAQVLTPNFNGMVHPGEAGDPDAANGFRSISDRGLSIDGLAGSLGGTVTGGSGLNYSIETAAGVLDIVHLGDRNTVDSGLRAFDLVADADNIGIQPSWLQNSDQTTVVNNLVPTVTLDAGSQLGLLYQISNGGGNFDVTLGFTDASSVTVTVNGPDWFGPFNGTPSPPGPGVAIQQNLAGSFTGSGNTDQADPDATLLVTEAVITAAELLTDLGFDVNGRELSSITFGNRSNTNSGYAVIAGAVQGAAAPPLQVPVFGPLATMVFVIGLLLLGLVVLRRQPASQ